MKTQIDNLLEKQAKEREALETKIRLENLFTDLCNFTPSIISPDSKYFAVFYPKTKDEYLGILNALQPTNENAKVTFAGKDFIQTFSPYLVNYGGLHESANYMEVIVKYKHSICPIWIKMPDEMIKEKFSVSRIAGKHTGFGHYEYKYTLKANESVTVQTYYGENKTMYAKYENEADQLKEIIFS